MAWTVDERAILAAAIASGVKTVDYGDRQVTYQNTDQMLKALSIMDSYLASVAGVSSIRRGYATFRRP